MYWRPAAIGLALWAAGCAPARQDPDAGRAALMQADRDFARATAERRLAGWVEAFADSGFQLRPGKPVAAGRDTVREFMAAAFADTTWTLGWEPARADISSSGDLGWTVGTYQSVRRDSAGAEHRATGKYLTVWQKQADGTWKVVVDTGVPD